MCRSELENFRHLFLKDKNYSTGGAYLVGAISVLDFASKSRAGFSSDFITTTGLNSEKFQIFVPAISFLIVNKLIKLHSEISECGASCVLQCIFSCLPPHPSPFSLRDHSP